jgi:hypothetical protein
MTVVVIRYKTKATARRALTFIVRIFVNDTIAIAVWTSFHVCVPRNRAYLDEAAYVMRLASGKRSQLSQVAEVPT